MHTMHLPLCWWSWRSRFKPHHGGWDWVIVAQLSELRVVGLVRSHWAGRAYAPFAPGRGGPPESVSHVAWDLKPNSPCPEPWRHWPRALPVSIQVIMASRWQRPVPPGSGPLAGSLSKSLRSSLSLRSGCVTNWSRVAFKNFWFVGVLNASGKKLTVCICAILNYNS